MMGGGKYGRMDGIGNPRAPKSTDKQNKSAFLYDLITFLKHATRKT